MKKKHLFILLFVSAVCTFLFYACRKTDVKSAKSEKFRDIQEWFTQALANRDSLQPNTIEKRILEWERGISYVVDSATIYRIPYISSSRKAFDLKPAGTNTDLPLSARTNDEFKYIIFRKHKTGIIDIAVMTVKGSRDYISNHADELKNNSYKHVTHDFSGFILYHSWDGAFLTGWKYDDGKISNQLSSAPATANAKEFCQTYRIDEWCEDCIDYYSNDEYNFTNCGTPYICDTWYTSYCYDDGTGDGSGGSGGFNGWYSDGTSSTTIPNLCDANVFEVKVVGNAFVGEIDGIIIHFNKSGVGATTITHTIPTICFTVPINVTKTPYATSEAIRTVINHAINQTVFDLNNGYPNPTAFGIKVQLNENLGTILQEEIPGASMIQSPCQGNIPKTTAKYNPNCH